MASSGTINIITESVDYPNYSRGAVKLTNVVGWSVDSNGKLSLWSISSSDNAGGSWTLYASSWHSGYKLIMDVQVNYGGGWQSVTSSESQEINPYPDGGVNAISASISCIGALGQPTLTANCQMRVLYYANRAPAPTSSLPNAFPDSGYSAAVQVPVDVDVSWTATLKYDANGGSGAPSNQTHSQSGDSYTFTVSNTKPTRTNYRFDGWTYNSHVYHGGDNITISKSTPTVTLVAKWTRYYRPGATLSTAGGNNVWYSHEKTNGACHILSDVSNNTWKELRTIDGASGGQGDPPLILHAANSSSWYNQKRLGKES